MPIDSFTATRLLTQIPSSRANLPPEPPMSTSYTISIQRRETSGQGRWREIAAWTLTTSETDMTGPLNCGLRPNYRIIVQPQEGPHKEASSTISHQQEPANGPSFTDPSHQIA